MKDNNSIQLIGQVIDDFIYSHSAMNETFYSTTMKIERLSGVYDYVDIIVSDNQININSSLKGKTFAVSGEIRTYNNKEVKFNKLRVYVLVDDMRELLLDEPITNGENVVHLIGFICKKSGVRDTPCGKRTICDVVLAVNRCDRHSSYIPLIFWNKLAVQVDKLKIGTQIEIDGRFQSRNYMKNIDGVEMELTAYEISVQSMRVK